MNNEWLNNLRNRMEDHEEDVPDGLWDDISDELFSEEEEKGFMAGFIPLTSAEDEDKNGKAGSGHKSLFYRVGGVAAAAALLFTLVKIWPKDDGDKILSKNQTSFHEKTKKSSVLESSEHQGNISIIEEKSGNGPSLAQFDMISADKLRQTRAEGFRKKEIGKNKGTQSEIRVSDMLEPAHQENRVTEEKSLANEPIINQPEEKESDEVLFKKEKESYADHAKHKGMKARSDRKWMLGMLTGNGASNGAEQQFPGYASINGKPMDVEEVWSASEFVDDPLTQILLANQSKPVEARIRHKVPVTFGLSIYHSLGKRWGIGTGLNYTKLSSELHSGSSANYIKGEQTVHYVGIPVQVNYNVIQKGKFTGYVTGGALVEKPVSGNISTTYVVNDEVKETSTERLENKPLQFSVNTAVGLQLKIVDRFGIYAEPGIGYHFKNENAPNTIYKEKPLQFNVKFGIRLLID